MTKLSKPMVPAQVCGTCAHYYQHYVLLSKGKWLPIWYGHCALPEIESRSPDEVCKNWQERED